MLSSARRVDEPVNGLLDQFDRALRALFRQGWELNAREHRRRLG